MDRVTREAIDERLRVLEGVSGAMYRCIEDLVRVRSALPIPTNITPTAPPSRSYSSAPPLNSDASGSNTYSPAPKVQPSIPPSEEYSDDPSAREPSTADAFADPVTEMPHADPSQNPTIPSGNNTPEEP